MKDEVKKHFIDILQAAEEIENFFREVDLAPDRLIAETLTN